MTRDITKCTACSVTADRTSLARWLLGAVHIPWKLWITSPATGIKQESNYTSKNNRTMAKHSTQTQQVAASSLFTTLIFLLNSATKTFQTSGAYTDTTHESRLIYCFLLTPVLECRLQQFQKKHASVQHILLGIYCCRNNSKKRQCLMTRNH